MTVGRHLICSIRNDEVTGEKSVLLQRRNKNEALLLHRKVVTVLSCVELEAVKRYFVKNLEAYACLGVLKLYVDEEYCFMYLFFVTGCTSIGKIASTEIYRINNCSYLSLQASSDCDSRINDLQRLLMSGCFYFSISKDASTSFELSLTAQNQYFGKVPDTRFFWNYSMHNHLKQFNINPENWLVRMMCGGVEIRTLYVGAKQARACLISRLSGERAGTRFNVRGTNDDGHVANFVETEQLIVFDDGTQSSFIQTRGSVPLFWEQTGVQVGAHKLKMSRGYEASSPAFERHISILKHIYGYQLLINLLGHKGGEAILSNAYKDHLKDSSHSFDTHMVAFDYHLHCGGGKTENIKILIEKAQPSIDNFQYFTLLGDKLLRSQVGTIRTNCIDCLDRTNAVQTEIGLNLLKKQLESVGITDLQSHSKFHEALKALWQLNGDHISRMYTGTGAMEAGTKGTIGSKLHDGAISVKRTLKNNFFDGSKQEAIDILLLGNSFIGSVGERARALLGKAYLHAPPKILRDICFQHKQFTKIHSMRVTVGTWNVNGGKHFRSIAYKHQSMHDWLLDYYKLAVEGILDHSETFDKATDIFAIGFEELVDLNTGNIISTSSNQKKEWGIKLQEVISRNHPYGLVSAEQLVGVCLFVFVRLQHIPYLRDVAVSVVKTGLKGKAGNKGAVAVRMLFHATSLCFVCGHFAAGQSNVLERNNNYHDISRRLCFPMGMSLGLHDYIFWCGDFNYRINLPYNEVKELLKEKQWPALLANDQLLMQKAEHKVFGDFIEGTINFPPTYKYDLFSNDYDTSEKMRTPAWTDRILWRRKKYINSNTISDDTDDDDIPPDWKVYKQSPVEMFNPGTIVYYGRAELKTSDHRPVIAVIDIEVEQTIKSKLQQIQREVLKVSELNEPTVFIDVEFEEKKVEIDLEELLQLLSVYGNLIMLRLLDNRFYATFDNGISAMNAVELNGRKLHNVTLSVTMASNNFLPQLEESFCTLMDDSFLIHKEDGEDLEKFNSSHRKMSEILLSSIGRQGSILEPEILNQQANYIEDYLDEIPDDILEEDIDLREENENLIKENLRVSSDEEDDMKLQHDSLNLLPTPKPRLQSKYIVDQAVQSTLPKRPDLPPQKVTLKPEKPQPPKLKQIPKVNPPRPDPVAPISISGNFPERPVRPDRKPSPSVKSPAPPRPPAVPKKDINKDGSNKEVELTHLSVEGKVDGGVSTPFNIQHLMHVNHSNVDEFISMMTLDVNKTNKPSTKRLSMHGSKSLNQFPKIPNRTSTEPIVTPNLMVTEQSLQKPVSPVLPHISKSNSTDSFLKAEAQNVSAGELSLVKSEESLQVSVPSSQAFLKKPPPRPKMRPVTLNLEDMAIDFQVPYNDINNSLSNLSPTDDLHQVPSKEIVASSFINNLVSNEKPPLPKRSPPGSCTSKSQSIPSFDVLENSEFSLLEKHPDRSIHLQSTDIKYKLPVESSEIKDCILPPVPPRLGNQQEDMSQRSNFSLGFITERSTLSEETTQIEQKKLNAPPPLPKRKDVKAPPPVPPR